MQERLNTLFDHAVNKGVIVYKFKGKQEATQIMVRAGLPMNIILRVLSKSQKIRSSDWS